MPAYYEDYMKKQYPRDYVNPFTAFKEIDQTMDFPAMAKLLYEVKNYRGSGIAAGLYYEAKVAEAVSLVVEEQKKLAHRKEKKLTAQDTAQLENVGAGLSRLLGLVNLSNTWFMSLYFVQLRIAKVNVN